MSKYLKTLQISFRYGLKNYKALIGLSVFLIICIVIFFHLWEVIAAKTAAVHMNRKALLWYIALNEWMLIALPHVERNIHGDLKSGKLAYLLPRPISYLGFCFFESLGTLLVNLLGLGVIAFGITYALVGGLSLPLSFWIVSAILTIMAGCLGILIQMIIGLSSFWLHDVEPVYWIWEKFLFALGGLILPLAIYPQGWQIVAKFSPFPYILGERSALALNYSLSHALSIMGNLAIWIGLALAVLNWVYYKGLKILNIEGG